MNHEQGKIKILKFGGSSVGSVERIKHVARLISDEQPKVVVLSAMSGTTDALAGIAAKLSGGDMDGALDDAARPGKQVFGGRRRAFTAAQEARERRKKHIQNSFSLVREICRKPFSAAGEKIILAQGELIVTRLMYLYLAETGVHAALLPAVDFIRTDKCGEPDMRFIRKHARKAINGYPPQPDFHYPGLHLPQRFGRNRQPATGRKRLHRFAARRRAGRLRDPDMDRTSTDCTATIRGSYPQPLRYADSLSTKLPNWPISARKSCTRPASCPPGKRTSRYDC